MGKTGLPYTNRSRRRAGQPLNYTMLGFPSFSMFSELSALADTHPQLRGIVR